ncbi:MAG: TetR family transcriptional regulator [Burkholderiales bacterium]|nr:TetR family transcriptional regulator [Burkholderiales bacterium]MBH2015427.1 TetR family transcriptional regulator [Burkholderiales bacterium]
MQNPEMAAGKRALMDAALRLLARQQQAETLSLRELAREAGLNHNTFYRHFDSLGQLQVQLLDEFTAQLREGTRAARADVARDPSVVRRVVGWLFDFAAGHRDLFLVAYRTLHGPPSEGRLGLQRCLDELRRDMLREQRAMKLLPEGHDEVWLRVLAVYGRAVYALVVRYLEGPEQRDALLAESEELLAILVMGTVTQHPPTARSQP